MELDGDCQNAVNTLKQKLIESPVLRYPDSSKQFTLITDASNYGIGAVLSQGHPCCYVSKTLNPAEVNYFTTEKEMLAIVWAIRRLRQYLLGRKFKIQIDHKALIWLMNVKDPSSRLLRWRLLLENYEYEIDYKKGKENQAADALSRVSLTTEELKEYGQQQNSTPWTRFVVWEATETLSISSYVATDKQDVILTPREIFDEEQWIEPPT